MVKIFLMQSCLFAYLFAVTSKAHTLTAFTGQILCTEKVYEILNMQEVKPVSKCLQTVSCFMNVS